MVEYRFNRKTQQPPVFSPCLQQHSYNPGFVSEQFFALSLHFVKYIFPTLLLVYVFTTTYANLKVLGVCFGAGYLFHCIEDCFADTGIPSLIFPIPQFWRKKVWGRMRLTPITITTGSLANTILDFIATGLAIFLLVIALRG